MNETVPNVYDLVYPSPVSLKEISSVVVVVTLWREKIRAHIENESLQELKLDLKEYYIRLKNVLPNLPSAIYDFMEEYVAIIAVSMLRWLYYHRENIFPCGGGSSKNILKRFHDFSWDWNGTIHYTRTAERMMLCDRLTEDEKFKIACLYCFEDDIKRIWPSVSAKMDLNEIDFNYCPQLFYWICVLRNELDKVPNPRNVSMDEAMHYKCESKSFNYSFFKYFWNRIPSDKHAQIIIEKYKHWSESFCRFILAKLNKCQLEMFLSAKGSDFVGFLLYFGSAAEIPIALRAWKYIQNEISNDAFISYINQSFSSEVGIGSEFYAFNKAYLFHEIWESAPQHLKRSAIEYLLSNNPSYLTDRGYSMWPKPLAFLLDVLQDATVEERNALWSKNWRYWIRWCGTTNRSNFLDLTKLCLQTDNEIALFNKKTMATYENTAGYYVPLLQLGSFEKIDEYLSICCVDVRERRQFKQRLLRSNYIGENSDRLLTKIVIRNSKLLNEFIDDAFRDAADLGVEFRKQFMSSPVIHKRLFECIGWGDYVDVMQFVDTFSSKELVVYLKKCILAHFNTHVLSGGILHVDRDVVQRFLIWLLGDEHEVTRYKLENPEIHQKLQNGLKRSHPQD